MRTSLGLFAAIAAAACSSSDPAPTPVAEPTATRAPAIAATPPAPASAPAAASAASAARVASPDDGDPAELIDVASVAPAIRVDMRYATTRNFTGVAFYPVGRCMLRRDAARRLARAQERLAGRGLGLLLWDCYRPFSAQELLWKLVHDPRYVARPVRGADGAPSEGSKHNRGAAVDLTLVTADGAAVKMPTEHDDFSSRAHRGSAAASPEARRSSAVLEEAMVAEGFIPLPTEWWHFDAPGWQRYPLSDEPIAPGPASAPAPAAR